MTTTTTAQRSPLVPRPRAESSTVRCGRCGATQRIDLQSGVLAQVRPFVLAHVPCGADAL